MPRSFSRATGPRAFRNVDVIHSGPAEPFRSILLMAYSSAERVNPFFELSNNIGIFDGHGRVVYFAVVINEDIGHCFSIDDRVTIMHRCLIGSLSQVYYLLHVLSIVIFYGVFKYFLPVVGLGIIDFALLGSLQASIDFWWLTWVVRRSQLRVPTVLTLGVIQGLAFLSRFGFP